MKIFFTSLALSLMLIFATSLKSSAIEIDLSTYDANIENSVQLSKNEYSISEIIIKNCLPNYSYSVTFGITNQPIIEFDKKNLELKHGEDPCGKVQKEFDDAILKLSDEKDIIKLLNNVIVECGTLQADELKNHYNLNRNFTTLYTLKKNQTLTVTIKRYPKNVKDSDKQWIIRYNTETLGNWITTFGFTFLCYSFDSFKNDDLYIKEYKGATRQDSTKYYIKSSKSEKILDFIPTVFFHWIFSTDELNTFVHGPTAGLGFDLSSPTLFIGYSLTYLQNISFNTGIGFSKIKTIKPEYKSAEDRYLKELVDTENLFDNNYKPNFFFSISLRFGENPFSNSSE